MNLLDEDFTRQKDDKTKKTIKIIVVFMVLIFVAIIGIVAYMSYLKSTTLKLYLNDQSNAAVKKLLIFEEDGTIYVPVRAISSYLGYNCYNGEYLNKSEDASKCYVECTGEVANLSLNSNKIYKLSLSSNTNNYTYIYMDKPVKAINGELYITTDGMQKVFNTYFGYDQNKNVISIYTSDYLIESHNNNILDYGYTKISENFENNKVVTKDMLVVSNDRYYGVINVSDGSEILECKYDDIIYQEATGDFIVCSNQKYGIIGVDKKTTISIVYDSIKLMDYDAGLYLVQKNKKYGVVDLKGNNIIYPENDQIGVDISKFEENELKTGYILVDSLIPVQRNGKWGLFNKKGNQLVDFEYDSFGYIATSNKEATNLLVIPNYNVIVACIQDRYTLLNQSGEQPFKAFVDAIYMQINGGEKSYKMLANNKEYDVEEYLDRLGLKPSTNNNNNENIDNNVENNTSSTNTENKENTSNTTNTSNTNSEDKENTSNTSNNEDNENNSSTNTSEDITTTDIESQE